MACTWRIRHKLWVGLALQLGITGMLLAGTFYGLTVYRASMSSHDSKLRELDKVQLLRGAVTKLVAASPTTSKDTLLVTISEVQQALQAYRHALQCTLDSGRDPDGGLAETGYSDDLTQQITRLEHLVQAIPDNGFEVNQRPLDIRRRTDVDDLIVKMNGSSGDLQEAIYKNLGKRNDEAKAAYSTSVGIVLSTSAVGSIVIASLLRLFYGWVFYPIRDLQLGAGRVAQGDFEHRIEVHSGDELEDLARAFNDMTDRLRLIYNDLARQVNERSRQLVRSERLASVGFLAAGVAHEINNPLASIAFCSEALEARLENLLAERRPRSMASLAAGDGSKGFESDREVINRYLRMIQQEAFRCKEITQRLLEFSRGGERRRESADLGDLVQSVLEMTQHLQNGKNKQIVFDPPGQVVAAVNAQEIKSVVLNLVVNALDSMDDGGRLTIRLSQRDGFATIEFADTGCGMTPEVLENIFEPFFTRSRTGKGTGLGLTISHRIINQHGGEIEAASPGINQGSTFTVRLPLEPAEPAKEETLGNLAA